MLDPPGPLHCIWPKTKLIAEDGDVRDCNGWAHCRADRLTLGVMFACVNVCVCRFENELSVGVIAQTSQRLTSKSASCVCVAGSVLFFLFTCGNIYWCFQALP